MVLNFPRNYQDGVTRFASGLHTALACNYLVEALTIAPTRFGAFPRRPDLQLLVAAEQLLQLIRYRPAVVHVHEHPVALAAAVAYRLLTFGSARLVYTVHIQPAHRLVFWKRAILGWLLARCSAVTCVSADTASRLADIARPLPRKVMVIHGGADTEQRAPEDSLLTQFRTRFGVHGGPVVCQIGLNYPLKVKGVMRLMEAVKLVRDEFPTVRLMLIGEGALRAIVADAAAQMGLVDAVILTGYQADISVPLSIADIYCHITFQDAAPLSVLEAMSCGKPIVAARKGGIPELVTDGVDAILVEPEPAQIALAIVQLLRDPVRANALGAAALQTARTRYTWRRVADEFAATYKLPSQARR